MSAQKEDYIDKHDDDDDDDGGVDDDVDDDDDWDNYAFGWHHKENNRNDIFYVVTQRNRATGIAQQSFDKGETREVNSQD